MIPEHHYDVWRPSSGPDVYLGYDRRASDCCSLLTCCGRRGLRKTTAFEPGSDDADCLTVSYLLQE